MRNEGIKIKYWFIALGAVVILIFAYISIPYLDLQRITALGGAVGAIATSAAAIAAWRASVHSEETARQAREALVASTRPNLYATFEVASVRRGGSPPVTEREFLVWNTTRWAATDVSLRFSDDTGAEYEAHADHVGGAVDSPYRKGELAYRKTRLRAKRKRGGLSTSRISHVEDGSLPSGMESLLTSFTTIEYSDEHGISRWRRVKKHECRWYRDDQGNASESAGPVSDDVERIR